MIRNIIFDFDGVVLDSIPVKTDGFRKLFSTYDEISVEKLVNYHLVNGGKSRYAKIEYFFNEILNQDISETKVLEYANKYSKITKKELANKKYVIQETLSYIESNFNKYRMHVASGADDQDLNYICTSLDLNKYFLSIEGSPKVKSEIVKGIIDLNRYSTNETILIGDSSNDFEAAKFNNIEFYGYNNPELKNRHKYIDSFLGFI
ncbi:HAD family hydrolase [Vibrio algarum]|uniref:phosphoglycolate phosphatase n=1 Tax=Vibrio algarum TaxID=3020714 RepID=A0ABT4YMX4_9VIBR|nr:HAD hydrolase-like protein [Vibrio sp. KJ40-1]MDB1122414.1 HAD hydrolase-like protein [Vibrio sp. KJ40-1]